jgi:hypothetical protein
MGKHKYHKGSAKVSPKKDLAPERPIGKHQEAISTFECFAFFFCRRREKNETDEEEKQHDKERARKAREEVDTDYDKKHKHDAAQLKDEQRAIKEAQRLDKQNKRQSAKTERKKKKGLEGLGKSKTLGKATMNAEIASSLQIEA